MAKKAKSDAIVPDDENTKGKYDYQDYPLSPDQNPGPGKNFNCGPVTTAPHGMYVHSYDPPCKEEAGYSAYWSSCVEARVDLPQGAQARAVILKVLMLPADGGEWRSVRPGQDVGWARFEDIREATIGGHTSWIARFKNWSHIYDRKIKICVSWNSYQ
jgi:hypothetical protein